MYQVLSQENWQLRAFLFSLDLATNLLVDPKNFNFPIYLKNKLKRTNSSWSIDEKRYFVNPEHTNSAIKN